MSKNTSQRLTDSFAKGLKEICEGKDAQIVALRAERDLANETIQSQEASKAEQLKELLHARAEVERLRKALQHIGFQSASMSTVDFSWQAEWHNLRNEARAALEVKE